MTPKEFANQLYRQIMAHNNSVGAAINGRSLVNDYAREFLSECSGQFDDDPDTCFRIMACIHEFNQNQLEWESFPNSPESTNWHDSHLGRMKKTISKYLPDFKS